jgi:GH24 family phage-related lysozyme (muramidase)
MSMGSHPLTYEPYPQIKPDAGSAPKEEIHTDADMFGGAIAKSLGTVGTGLQHASDEGFSFATQQAQMDGRTHATEIHSWQSDRDTDAQEKFLTLRGKDAEMALPAFKQQIEDNHRQAREQANNPYTQQLVDTEGRRLTDIAYSQAARHAAQQRTSWDTTTSVDAATSAGNRAVIAATTAPPDVPLNAHPSLVLSLGRSDDFARQAAQLKSLDGDTEVGLNRGKNVKNIVEQITRDGSPDGLKRAVEFYNAQKDRIDAGVSTQISNFLAAPLNTLAGQARADEVMGRPPVQSQPRMVADIPASFVGAIKQTEGYDARPRWDVKQWTVGFGTRASGPDERVDPAQAEARFNTEISKAAKIVDSVNPNLDAGTRAALTSLTFETGDSWVRSGLGEKVRAGDMNAARETFLQYNKVQSDGGLQVDPGVAARRAREASWFGRGDISPAESIQPRIDKGTAMLRIMDDPELQQRPQVQAAALAHINKLYEAYHFQDAQQSAAFNLKLHGSIAELRDTGQLTNPIQHDEFLNGLGPQKGETAWQDYQKDVQLGSDMRSLAGQSPQELGDTIAKYSKLTPGDDYGRQAERRDSVIKAAQANQTAKLKDPADFVIRRTDSGEASYKQFTQLLSDKDATPGMRTAYAQMFASKMLAEQERLGVPPQMRKVAPDWYTGPIKDKIAAAATADDPKDRQAVPQLIAAQKELWGDYWPNIAAQIAPPGAAPLVKAIAAGADPVAMQRLLDIPKGESPAKILKEQNEVNAKNLNTSLNTAFAPFLGSMVGLQKDRDYSGYAALGTELGALYVRDGMSEKEAAAKAFNDLIGNRYDFRDTYRIPKDPTINPDDVQRGVYEATQEMQRVRNGDASSPFGNIQLQHNDLGVTDNEADMRHGLARDARFVTSPHNDGLNLLVGTKFVKQGDGLPILLTWDRLQKMGGTKESHAADASRAIVGSEQSP